MGRKNFSFVSTDCEVIVSDNIAVHLAHIGIEENATAIFQLAVDAIREHWKCHDQVPRTTTHFCKYPRTDFELVVWVKDCFGSIAAEVVSKTEFIHRGQFSVETDSEFADFLSS